MTLEQQLENPLFAEQYYDDLVDRMVELFIQNDPAVEDNAKQGIIEDTRTEALNRAKEATSRQRDGVLGSFVSVKEHAEGEVLFLDGMLYLGPEFLSQPGPDLHIYLSKLIDPREEGSFPDADALDVGRVESPYGAQTYTVIGAEDPTAFHSAVLWDTKLERMYGFAQF